MLELDEIVRLEVPLKSGSQLIESHILFDPSSQLLLWRAPLLEERSEQQLFHFNVLNGEPGYLALTQAAELGRLRTTDEEGPVFEIVLPMTIETLSESTVRLLIVEMGWAFTLQRACKWAVDGGGMELSPWDEPEMPDMAKQEEEPAAKPARFVAKGRVAEIDRAIQQGDINLARRLSRGGDIDIPDAV